ncbi:MAG TPA: inositol monophosphatase family protein [Chloroflexia bacterium]|nr:inositol monophosphatase family protein [Chloroflexia bacterium]
MYEEYLAVAQEAARAAGAIQVEGLSRDLRIATKSSPIDLVTEVDRHCESEIARIIAERFPEHRLLAEEGTTAGDHPEYLWIVDPLDGTTNYTHRYPFFSTSIALEHQGQLVAGVVYNPVSNEMFWATSGGGAFLNGAPIAVSNSPTLSKSLLCTGFPGDQAGNQRVLASWEKISLRCQGIRRDGSAALDLCFVACGRFDGFWERLNPWDMAAGALIVQEAGGKLTNFSGGSFDLFAREIVASNPFIDQEMITVLHEEA